MSLNLNLNPIWIEAGVATAIAAMGAVAILWRGASASRDLNSLRQECSAEIAALRDLVTTLQSKVEELAAAEDDRTVSPGPFLPQSALNINKRTEALRMYNRGGDADAVRNATGLPKADAMLLRKVQRVLSAPIAGTPQPSGNHANSALRAASH